jgi:DNA repair protein RadC
MSRPAKKSPANDQSASAREAGVAYTPMLRDLPQDVHPSERMLMAGPGALSNAELLAILLRIGVAGESVVHVAENLLVRFGGLPGIAQANFEELCAVNGVGPAKATQLKAALEIGRRLLLALPQDRLQIRSPADVSDLLWFATQIYRHSTRVRSGFDSFLSA